MLVEDLRSSAVNTGTEMNFSFAEEWLARSIFSLSEEGGGLGDEFGRQENDKLALYLWSSFFKTKNENAFQKCW